MSIIIDDVMKILQNETTNNTSTTSTSATATPNSKEKQEHLQQTTCQSQQQIVEKRKAKTLKNKILQNVAQQQQQQEVLYQHQQRQLQQNAIANNNTTSAMTDEATKLNCNNNSNKNSTKTNNSNTADIKTATTPTSSAAATLLLKDSLKDSSASVSIHNNKDSCNNNSDLIIAEAAKILLKNGLNGTNAAAAAAVATATATLLTAAANFHQIPTVSDTITSTKCNLTSGLSTTATSISDTSKLASNVTTAAAAAHAQLVAIAAAAAAVSATNQKRLTNLPTSTLSTTETASTSTFSTCNSPNQNVNNGLLDDIRTQATSATTSVPTTFGISATTQFTKPYKTSSCKSTMSASMDMAIFDYSSNLNSNNTASTAAATPSTLASSLQSSVINLSTSANNGSNTSNSNIGQQKCHNIHSHSNRSDIGRPSISQLHHQTSNINNVKNTVSSGGHGGRLQFFKDGKFILELARSKDGEKEGWVSVPRKLFRTPSAATSATVTPSATASTSTPTIPSSLASSPPVVVGSTTYPKNECSNSLSFSDDNSSIQSSPWQRDHCWKQTAPRKNVSKELKLFYRRPACHKFTTEAIKLSHRKRRKPYDMKRLENGVIFGLNIKKELQQQQHSQHGQNKQVGKSRQVEEETKKKPLIENKENDGDASAKNVGSKAEDAKTIINDMCNDPKENYGKCSDNKPVVKIEPETEEAKDVDVKITKPSSPSEANINNDTKSLNATREETICENDTVEEMNTSGCADEEEDKNANPIKNSKSSNGNVSKEDVLRQTQHLPATQQEDYLKTGDEEKRLKKHEHYKTRAKLTAIVQKLIDVSTSRLIAKTSNAATLTIPASCTSSLSSTSTNVALTSGGAKNQSSKISPPSNTAASRLVEYHQQHVSPRKRILREFEKVSLEDNLSGACGGKRSRSKGSNTSATTNATNATNATVMSSLSSAIPTNRAMHLNTINSNAGNTQKSASTAAAPTKLYSSYSIHSLLGGGTSTSTAPSPAAKKSSDFAATITSSTMAFSSYNSATFSSNSPSNNTPKSPEGNNYVGGGKSPSSSVTKSKRSPPYSSPMRETPSRSPITCGSGGYTDYSGRRSPRSTPDTAHSKLRYTSSGGTDSTAAPTSHHLQHHLQQHYQHQPQTYYSPYMMSPHYVPPLSCSNALSPNATPSANASSSASSSRSPRHHPSAFRATTPTTASSTTHNIPSTQKGDVSPQRSTTASPRETTPRTVPKKTASIRRQFASPPSATTQNHNNSNCSSPTTTSDEQLTSDRRTPVNSNSSHQQNQQPQHLMQRGSPGNTSLAGSPVHPYSYLYAQPPNGSNSPHTSNAAGSNHPSSTMSPSSVNASAAVAAAAAAAAASYIPAVVGSPYYHPYISTLAAMRHPQMWMQHYQSAAAAAANPALMHARHPAILSAAAAAGAAARLSPTYHGFQYNGIGNAAALAAAAAAAAAGFGSAATSPHTSNALLHPSSMFNSMANSSLHGMQHPTTAMHTAGLVPASAAAAASSTDTTDLSKSTKNNFSSGISASALGVGGPSGNLMYTGCNKDEQSSDVPLNLSKH